MPDEEPDRDDILRLARHAGLHLPPAYLEEVVAAYRHVRRLVAILPRHEAYEDEPAHTFDPSRFEPTND